MLPYSLAGLGFVDVFHFDHCGLHVTLLWVTRVCLFRLAGLGHLMPRVTVDILI